MKSKIAPMHILLILIVTMFSVEARAASISLPSNKPSMVESVAKHLKAGEGLDFLQDGIDYYFNNYKEAMKRQNSEDDIYVAANMAWNYAVGYMMLANYLNDDKVFQKSISLIMMIGEVCFRMNEKQTQENYVKTREVLLHQLQ
ncbi:hypothetical protein LJC09_03590 [Desulfovibrio sp. OttesenSCG-928-F20]|nr:hypothetical protein [Desulfovibrio sp. OttesenSCG-928-F20]